MEPVTCCYCKDKIENHREYVLIKRMDNGRSRIYTGHKSCLFVVEARLNSGTEQGIPYTEMDTPKWGYEEVTLEDEPN